MKINELLKQYRVKEGKTQKEFVGDLMTTSYYSKIEKGDHRISAEDLLAILERNGISFWYFFKDVSIKGELHQMHLSRLGSELIKAYYAQDRKKVNDLLNNVKNSNLPDKQEEILLIRGWLETMKTDDEEPDYEIRDQVKKKIFLSGDLNQHKLELFCNFMEFYDLESNYLLLKQFLKYGLLEKVVSRSKLS